MKTIVANWKMNVGAREGVALARGALLALRGKRHLPEVVLCPPFIALPEVRKVIARSQQVRLGAQNMHWEEQGSFTGEISSRMLQEVGATHVVLGHSERRNIMGETDEMVQKKAAAALAANLVPIICVGENAEEREAGQAHERVGGQLRMALRDVPERRRSTLMIAYEPIWAIGSGDPATPEQAVEMHAFIRAQAAELARDVQVRVLYGGSVDGGNAYSFLREKEVDGVLVGGASVKLNQFAEVLDAASDVIEGLETASA